MNFHITDAYAIAQRFVDDGKLKKADISSNEESVFLSVEYVKSDGATAKHVFAVKGEGELSPQRYHSIVAQLTQIALNPTVFAPEQKPERESERIAKKIPELKKLLDATGFVANFEYNKRGLKAMPTVSDVKFYARVRADKKVTVTVQSANSISADALADVHRFVSELAKRAEFIVNYLELPAKEAENADAETETEAEETV